jgi:hypothetical protein
MVAEGPSRRILAEPIELPAEPKPADPVEREPEPQAATVE